MGIRISVWDTNGARILLAFACCIFQARPMLMARYKFTSFSTRLENRMLIATNGWEYGELL